MNTCTKAQVILQIVLGTASIIAAGVPCAYAKDRIYFSKDKRTAPLTGESIFSPGDSIYAWVQFEKPGQARSEDFNIKYRYPIANGKDQGKILTVPAAFLQNCQPAAPNGLTQGFGFWLVASAAQAKGAIDPDNFLSAMSDMSSGVQMIQWEGFNAQGVLKYDSRVGRDKILKQLTEVQLAEGAQLAPATLQGSPEEKDLIALVKSAPDFSRKLVKDVRFTSAWTETTRDSHLIMMRFIDSQVAIAESAGQHCELWKLQIKQDPGGMSIFRSNKAAIHCAAIK